MASLQSLELMLRVVTPMACGNADFLAEVRPPSFRGVARYWHRTLLGGILGAVLCGLPSMAFGALGWLGSGKGRIGLRNGAIFGITAGMIVGLAMGALSGWIGVSLAGLGGLVGAGVGLTLSAWLWRIVRR